MTSAGDQSKRVALLLPSLQGGGVRRMMVNLARGLTGEGLPVDMVLGQVTGSYLDQLPPQVRLVDLRSPRTSLALPALVRYLKRERPSALLSAMEHVNLLALAARRLARLPLRVVVGVHAVYSYEWRHFARRRNRLLVPLLVRRLYPQADAVVAVSEGVAADLAAAAGLPRERISVIHNPVVTPELLRLIDEPAGHPWFAAGEPPVVLSAGRLTAEKDFPTLLRAFARLRRRLPARLLIVGEGTERPHLEALARELELQDDFALPGFTANPYRYMSRAAVFALSSKWEGFGNVLVEALAAGLPVVSTDCPGGPSEILGQGRYGRLLPPGDEEALAGALEETIKRPPPRELLRRRAMDFTLERIVPLYRKVLGL